jgi:ketosteroid isomerase-like protein
MTRENVEIARRCFAAFEERNRSEFLELLHPDVEWVPAIAVVLPDDLIYDSYEGHEGVRRWFADTERFSEYRVEPQEFRDLGGDHVLVIAKVALMESQHAYVYDVHFVLTMRDGKVAAGRTYSDEAQALEAAGAGSK